MSCVLQGFDSNVLSMINLMSNTCTVYIKMFSSCYTGYALETPVLKFSDHCFEINYSNQRVVYIPFVLPDHDLKFISVLAAGCPIHM